MEKLATFIVNKRKLVIAIFVAATAICAVLFFHVNVNHDMLKYMPEDSSAREGMAVMDSEFGEASAIRLMFVGLEDSQKMQVYEQLTQIEHVDDVLYEADNADYNREDNTLYVVNVAAGSYSDAAKDVMRQINTLYEDSYEFYATGLTADSMHPILQPWIVIVALTLLVGILFFLCSSWMEPILFIICIAIAIVINAGTNIIFADVSVTTQSIAAILQLVLSMDYSIMLMDRYRQVRQGNPDKEQAMVIALKESFASIAGSSATTVVGLLCLVFMSFTIGRDMGLVLAKGVAFSLISILFVLPGLSVIFDKQIENSKKWTPRFNMNGIATFSYKARYAVLLAFVLLFTGGFLLKDNAQTDFTLRSSNPDYPIMQQVFPEENTFIVLYDNAAESKLDNIVAYIERTNGIQSVNAYTNTLGKQYSYQQMAAEMDMDADVIRMFYYYYFNGGDTGSITMETLLRFVVDDVSQNEMFTDYFDDATKAQLTALSKFANRGALTRNMTSTQMAGFLGMNAADAKQLYLLYFMQNGGVDTGKMSLPAFVQFVRTDIATNEQFAGLIPPDALAQLDALAAYTDTAAITKQMNRTQIAAA
ncbi:MMPL family transporter, partial [Eubacteriales bacterium OttesenSCG-928-N14]|nr:MMPL family transporter [Eubacteriales bacterium OttesenSCG-928-N14]